MDRYILLTALIFLAIAWFGNVRSEKNNIEQYSNKIQSSISERVRYGASFIEKAGQGIIKFTDGDIVDLEARKIFLYSYLKNPQDSVSLESWSSNMILPDLQHENFDNDLKLYELGNGFYLGKKITKDPIFHILLIPVKWNFIVNNDYLQNRFVGLPEISSDIRIVAGKAAMGNIVDDKGRSIFHILAPLRSGSVNSPRFTIILSVLGLLFIILFIKRYTNRYLIAGKWLKGFALLVVLLLVLRLLLYANIFPISLRQFNLWDPTIYGSSIINKSLGHLLLNVLCALWLTNYIYNIKERHKAISPAVKPWLRWVLFIACTIAFIAVAAMAASIIRSLIANSQISFDVLNFFSLDKFSAVGFFIINCVALSFYYISRVLARFMQRLWAGHKIFILLIMAVLGLIFLSLKIGTLGYGFEIYLHFWIVLYASILLFTNKSILSLPRRKIGPIFWIFFFCVSVVAIIVKENAVKEIENRQHYAEVLAVKSNPATESLLHSMLTDYRTDFLANNFYKFYKEKSAFAFKDSLLSTSFSVYNNRFETDILTFDSTERPLANSSTISFNEINSILTTQSAATDIPGLYTYDQSYDNFHYLIKKTIIDTDSSLLGYIFIRVIPRGTLQATIYPALFSRPGTSSIESASDYAFAVYDSGRLVRSHNQYSFPRKVKADFFAGKKFLLLESESHTVLWYKPWAQKAIAIAREKQLAIETITLFSYLFGSFLILAIVWFALRFIFRSNFKWRRIKNIFSLTINKEIYGTILVFSIVSFIVIGISTILFFISKYEDNNRGEVSMLQQRIMLAIKGDSLLTAALLSKQQMGSDSAEVLIDRLKQMSDLYGVDMNLYDSAGHLILSSLPLPYEKGIVSKQMHPLAFNHLSDKNEINFYQKENIGSLQYLSSYVPLSDASGESKTYLNIPFFASQVKLREEISGFLVTIINLNAFIFLIAGIIALYITNRITNSINIIGNKMHQVRLGKRNDPIEWRREDEIGRLVREYNRMLASLEESAINLSKTERETAWREMAKQVAHEIKNPLTPMRLSMQFLQKAIDSNKPGIEDLVSSVSKTLIEQIDHLASMADEFSRFAQIEIARSEPVDLQDILKSLQQLYSTHDKAKISWGILEQPVIILGDKTGLNRIFTNLLQNAVESLSAARPGKITVTQHKNEYTVVTEVADNGTGIPPEDSNNIFMPNFTTKSSGTGLGLAMSKRIVELMGGEINFISNESGTTFSVSLPIAPSS